MPSRRDVVNGALLVASVPVAFDLVQDLGVDFGDDAKPVPPPAVPAGCEVAVFAGGCFWCMEEPFDKLGEGVLSTTSGYTGGRVEAPSYREVSSGTTGHAEAVEVVYDPSKVSYEQLLDAFWHSVDPTTLNRQFVDAGTQYRSGIFYTSEAQREAAEASKRAFEEKKTFGPAPIVVEITPAMPFYTAEKYHQDYYIKKASKYNFYRSLSGRDEYIQTIWGPDSPYIHHR